MFLPDAGPSLAGRRGGQHGPTGSRYMLDIGIVNLEFIFFRFIYYIVKLRFFDIHIKKELNENLSPGCRENGFRGSI